MRWLISSIADRVTALHRFLPLQRLPERDRAQVSVNSADGFPKEGPNFKALAAFRKRFRSYSLHMVQGPVGATKGAAASEDCEPWFDACKNFGVLARHRRVEKRGKGFHVLENLSFFPFLLTARQFSLQGGVS